MAELTKAQMKKVADDMRVRIAAGEFTDELQQEIAPMLVEQAGTIVRKGVAQNTKAVVVSPWTLVKWLGRNVQTGAIAIKVRAAAKKQPTEAAPAY